MFDWIGKIVEAISNSIGNMVSFLGTQLANAIFDAILKWFYEMIYNAVADFFTEMGKMGAEMFDLSWVQATVTLFTYFGWALFAAGTVVAIFDVAVEYQSGRANIKTASINVIKGFFACSLIGIVPIELYKFCIVYFECWFDADRKFGIDTSENDAWLNMYGRYNPYEDTLTIECEIDRDDGSSYFDYFPTDAETQLMKDLITEKIQEVYHQSPKEFCESAFDDDITITAI